MVPSGKFALLYLMLYSKSWWYGNIGCYVAKGGIKNQIGFWPKLHISNQRKAIFLWVCCFLAKNYLILHPSLENLTINIAIEFISKRSRNLNRICKFCILDSMPSDEWFKLVDIALDKFSLKIVNNKSHLQFCKSRKRFFMWLPPSY